MLKCEPVCWADRNYFLNFVPWTSTHDLNLCELMGFGLFFASFLVLVSDPYPC